MEITFEKRADNQSYIAFRMIFETAGDCDKIRNFAVPKNEENFDRSERELSIMK